MREFAVTLDAPVAKVIERCAAEGVNPGFPLEDDGLLIAITEQRSREDIDRLARVLGAAVAAEREAVTRDQREPPARRPRASKATTPQSAPLARSSRRRCSATAR